MQTHLRNRQTLKPTVVILLSDKRSGSTIFQKEFAKHETVQTLRYSSHTYLESHHWIKAAVMLGMPPRFFSGGKVYPGYGGKANARAYMIDTIRGNLSDFKTPEDDRDLVFEGWEALCREFAQQIFFEKSPQALANWAALSLMLEWAQTTSFNVRFVALIRNPLAVQHSSEKLFGTRPEIRQFGWAEAYQNLLSFKAIAPPEMLHIMRHEDILSAPQEQFLKLCAFIGLPPDEQMGASVTAATQERWRSDPTYTLSLHPSVRQIAEAFGYGEHDLDNPNGVQLDLSKLPLLDNTRPVQKMKNILVNRVVRPWKLRRKMSSGQH